MMIEDWELLALYRGERKGGESEAGAIAKVKEKYLNWMKKERDLYLLLGTESRWNNWRLLSQEDSCPYKRRIRK